MITTSGIIIIIFIIIATAFLLRVLTKRHKKQIATLIQEIEEIRKSSSEEPVDNSSTNSLPNINDCNEFLKQVINIVNNRLGKGNCNVAIIANLLNMSEQTFRRRLRDITGESPKLFISAIQMEHAAHLIITDLQLPINNIANLCGYEETSSFSHAFKRIYGCTPTQYRIKNKNNIS